MITSSNMFWLIKAVFLYFLWLKAYFLKICSIEFKSYIKTYHKNETRSNIFNTLNYPIITKETYGGDIPKVTANKKFS